jgi:hypothetical protein
MDNLIRRTTVYSENIRKARKFKTTALQDIDFYSKNYGPARV